MPCKSTLPDATISDARTALTKLRDAWYNAQSPFLIGDVAVKDMSFEEFCVTYVLTHNMRRISSNQ